jgi:hypothetical protein
LRRGSAHWQGWANGTTGLALQLSHGAGSAAGDVDVVS